MKALFLFTLLLCGVEVSAQKGKPIYPYNENGYTLAYVDSFLVHGVDTLAFNWRNEFVPIINSGLEAAHETLRITDAHLSWALLQIRYEYVELGAFVNSMRVGNRIVFFTDYAFKGTVAVFYYGKCRIIVFKIICLNLLKIPQVFKTNIPAPKQNDPYVPVPAPTAPIQTIMNINITLVNNITNISYGSREPEYHMPAETWVGGGPPQSCGGGYYSQTACAPRVANVAPGFYEMTVDRNYTEGNLCQKFRELRNQ